MPKPRSQSWLAKPLLAIGATLLAVLLCEALARTLHLAPGIKPLRMGALDCVYKRSSNPILGFELRENYRSDNPDYIQRYERTNQHGFRDVDRTRVKPPGVRRIIMLGDSVVEGHGLRQSDTISRQLERLYPDGQTEVLNFGISAYCTRAEVELLETKGLDFDPDVVVLVFVENDFDNFNREAFPLGAESPRPAAINSLFENSHLVRAACLRWNLFQFTAEMDPVTWNKRAIGDNNVADGLRRLASLSRDHGFQPLVAIWPRFFDDRIADVHFVSSDGDARSLIVEALARAHGLPSVRLSRFFSQQLAALPSGTNPRLRFTQGDQLHPSPEGCRVAAEAIRLAINGAQDRQPRATDFTEGSTVARAAAEQARRLGSDTPTYARVFNRIGTELLKSGKPAEAAEQFQLALEADPRHAGALNNLGVAYERLGRGDAIDQFRRAIQIEPDFVHAHFNLARMLLKSDDFTRAIPALERTIQIDPGHDEARRKLALELGKQRRFNEARAHFEQLVKNNPRDSEDRNNLGVVYASLQQIDAAIQQFREAIRLDPSNQRALLNLRSTQGLRRQ